MARQWYETESNGVTRLVRMEEETDGTVRFTETLTQDAEPVVEANKRAQTANDGYSASRDIRRAASIPIGLLLQWKHEEGINFWDENDWPAVKRKLNSNEYRHLRTAEGVL